MRRIRSTNPVLSRSSEYGYVSDTPITYANIAMKTVFLIMLAATSAVLSIQYGLYSPGLLIGGLIIGFVAVIVGTRSMRLAPYAGVVYALSEGLVLGLFSALFESMYPGIVITAITTTGLVFIIMLLLFSTQVIKVNQKFASFMVVALMSVIIMSLLGIFIPGLFSGGFYIVVVLISAALSAFFLLLDFQAIKTSIDSGMDQKVGWILALGLMVTIVWIYIEMLRLLAIFSRNN